MEENNYSSHSDNFNEKMAEAKLKGEPVLTAYQKQTIDSMPDKCIVVFDDIDMSLKECNNSDIMLSLHRPGFFARVFNYVKSFFKRMFGIKDDSYIIKLSKNRLKTGNAEFTINYKTNKITQKNKNK